MSKLTCGFVKTLCAALFFIFFTRDVECNASCRKLISQNLSSKFSGSSINIKNAFPDMGGLLIQKLREILPQHTIAAIAGGKIDIFDSNKADAIRHYVDNHTDVDLNTSIFFGDGFSKNGNDAPVVRLREKYSNFKIVSVDERGPDVEGVFWVMSQKNKTGPDKIETMLAQIRDVLIRKEPVGNVEYEGKVIFEFDSEQLRKKGALIFDIDGTLLKGETDTFENHERLKELFSWFLNEQIRIVAVSGNSLLAQETRMVNSLMGAGANLETFSLYVDGGKTLTTYVPQRQIISIGDPISDFDVAKIKGALDAVLKEHRLSAWQVKLLDNYSGS